MSEVIRINSVTKRFDLNAKSLNSLKEKVLYMKHKNSSSDFLAVDNVSAIVNDGETVGLIGHNGSGKSTLLKCVAGVLRPTSGSISIRGRVAALLELGAGMEPDLTARENIYLNGALLGFSEKQMKSKFDEIVHFSELEKFIDTQVRFYSSGMQIRLGFSVAINVDPDVLLIDEVLAVGDESFQRKCIGKIKRFQKQGKAILFVSHAADQVRQICDRVIVMDHGVVVADGDVPEGIRTFRESLVNENEVQYIDDGAVSRNGSAGESFQVHGAIKIVKIDFCDNKGVSKKRFESGSPMKVQIHYDAKEKINNPSFSFRFYTPDGHLLFNTASIFLKKDLGILYGEGICEIDIESLPLNDGDYVVSAGIASNDSSKVYDFQESINRFSVISHHSTQGWIVLDHEMSIADNT